MNNRSLRNVSAVMAALFVVLTSVAQASPTRAVPGSPTNYRYFDRLSTATGTIRPPGTDSALVVPANNRCTSQAKTWVVSGNTCSATTGTTTNGVTQNVASNNGNSGIGKFTCAVATNSYTYVATGSTCTPPAPANCSSKLVNWTVGGTSCSGTVSSTPNGGNVGVLASSGANTGTGNFTCNSVSDTYTFVASGSSCNVPPPTTCTNQTKSWTQGGNTCSAPTGTSNANEVKTLTSNNGTLGAGSFTCDAATNTYTFNSGASNCYPAGCTSQNKAWVVGGTTCQGSTGTNGNGTRKAVSSTNGNNGTANWDCNSTNDTYSLVSSGATCAVPTPPTCAAQTLNWTATTSRGTFSCSASAAQTNDGQTAILSSSNAQMGTANFVCNAGTFAVSGSPTCHPTTCSSQNLGWVQGTPNCAGASGIVNHGVLKNIVSTNGNNGSGNFTCNAATNAYAFSSAGSTCAAPRPATCANSAVNWSSGGNTCTGGTGVVNDGATARIAATGTNTGTADVTCDSVNGYSVTGLTCTVPTPPPPPNCTSQTKSWTVGANTCSGSTGVTTGGTNKVVSATVGGTGQATFACNNATDTYSLQGAATCSLPPTKLSSVSKLSIGLGSNACVIVNGAAKCWGNNYYGQLGDGTTTHSLLPVQVSGLTSGVTDIHSSSYHTCAIHNGAAKCWGNNSRGQLGDGTTTDSSLPVQVTGLTSGVNQIGTGSSVSCAIHNGAAKCWGINYYGQLGNGTTTSSSTPVQVTGLTSGVDQIGGGTFHTCAIHNGAAKCWGYNGSGQLGNGTTTDSSLPVQVTGLTSGIVELDSGQEHSCAKNNANKLMCWGQDNYGALGVGGSWANGGRPDQTTPKNVLTSEGVSSFGAADVGGCAILLSNKVECWGSNSFGQLGNGETGGWSNQSGYYNPEPYVTARTAPVPVTSQSETFKKIEGGYGVTCGITSNDNVACWGGDRPRNTNTGGIPEVIVGNVKNTISLSASRYGACALSSLGAVKCWGANSSFSGARFPFYRLGRSGSASDSYIPGDIVGAASGVAGMNLSADTSCVILSGKFNCIGFRHDRINSATALYEVAHNVASLKQATISGLFFLDTSGVLKNSSGTTLASDADFLFSQVGDDTGAFTSSSQSFCFVTKAGAAKCFGRNQYGSVGNGTTTSSTTPVQVTGLTSGVSKGETGGRGITSCAIHNGAAKCWGYNFNGQLGNGSTTSSNIPAQVTGLTSGVTDIAMGGFHGCAIHNGAAKCWGANNNGQLGDRTTTDSLLPVQVTGLTSGVSKIIAGEAHTCALLTSDEIKCWGFNYHGQLGRQSLFPGAPMTLVPN